MKHSPKIYATAFIGAIKDASPADKNMIAERLVAVVRKNGHQTLLPQIVREAERMVLSENGGRKITIETAREVSPSAKRILASIANKNDLIEEKISPEIAAGTRITINDEVLWDGSLAGKIKRIFNAQI